MAHNLRTLELKKRYRKENKCVDCGKPNTLTRYCSDCQTNYTKANRNNEFQNNRDAKAGKFGQLKEILKLC